MATVLTLCRSLKGIYYDPTQLTEPTQRLKFVAFLHETIPEARTWVPPPSPYTGTAQPQSPSPMEIEAAKIAPLIPDDAKHVYCSLNRTLATACRQNPQISDVKIERLIAASGLQPEGWDFCVTPEASSDGHVFLENLIAPDDECDSNELLTCLHELKHWLVNCGATRVDITARCSGKKNLGIDGLDEDGDSQYKPVVVEDFDVTLQAPPAIKLLLLPLQLATQRLVHQIEKLDLGSCTVTW